MSALANEVIYSTVKLTSPKISFYGVERGDGHLKRRQVGRVPVGSFGHVPRVGGLARGCSIHDELCAIASMGGCGSA